MSLDALSVLRMAVADMAALKVRIRSRRRVAPPEYFYQTLPPEKVTLLATLPRDGFAVSIPQGDSWRGGSAFAAACPSSATGSVIIYRLQENCRYEAVAVRDGGREYPLEEFVAVAATRMREYCGALSRIPGKYAYAAPDKEEWGGILSDDGHVALNPERLSLAPHAPANQPERHGHLLQIRAPLYSGDRQITKNPLAVFSRVEVLDESAESRWLGFEEYQKVRALQAVVPAVIAADFGAWLAHLTKESGFDRWRFRPGMGFGAETEWWGPRGRRRTTHEGLDFVEGFRGDAVNLVPEGTPVCAVASGEVVAALDDFMGKTVVVRHPSSRQSNGMVFHTLLSHIQTEGALPASVVKGELLGRVGKRPGVRIRPHLHLTGAWYPADFPFADAGIDTIMHPGFTPAVLANLNPLVEQNPLCLITPDDREFLAGD
ncbi:MAG: M23 family metallopeptidase [Acidobacteriota bacterium]|jgi:murein DD-endopeptidase MepM/ murein hydrolase activator NlpD|nr:M23 family metallopeptidase [Acidobacteriota bacterium]